MTISDDEQIIQDLQWRKYFHKLDVNYDHEDIDTITLLLFSAPFNFDLEKDYLPEFFTDNNIKFKKAGMSNKKPYYKYYYNNRNYSLAFNIFEFINREYLHEEVLLFLKEKYLVEKIKSTEV